LTRIAPQTVQPQRADVADGFPGLVETAKVAKRRPPGVFSREAPGDVRVDLLSQMELQLLLKLRRSVLPRDYPANLRDETAEHLELPERASLRLEDSAHRQRELLPAAGFGLQTPAAGYGDGVDPCSPVVLRRLHLRPDVAAELQPVQRGI